MTRLLPDQSARDRALDVEHSYIVQAPAGSGKTELLTLRYLKLLVTCEQPEEVLAITFTKKAASEMRDRIIRALNWSQDCLDGISKPENGIEELRFAIGQTVLQRDQELGWRLLDNPSRFRVQTIDSFCFYLAKQLPILSQVGGDPQLLENIDHCFHEAVNSTLRYLESDLPIADDIEILLAHLDNDIARAQELLSNLLQQRDQWSNHLFKLDVPGQEGGENLTDNIAEWVSETLSHVRNQLQSEEAVLVELFNFAAAYRDQEDNLPIKDYSSLTALPGTTLDDLPYWQVILEFLLTQDLRNP
ncbi:MAG: UvrD-helicase domain-containing protein, partial [Pseudomonadales bacterium]|nr:UvrD-helicase domain-containing protein [Pseudomonadales bacterium]